MQVRKVNKISLHNKVPWLSRETVRQWRQSDAFLPFVTPFLITPGIPWLNLRAVTGEMWGSEHRHWRLSTLVPIVQPSQSTQFYFCLPLSFYYFPNPPLRVYLFISCSFSFSINHFIDFFFCCWFDSKSPSVPALFIGSAFFPWQQTEKKLGHGIQKLTR